MTPEDKAKFDAIVAKHNYKTPVQQQAAASDWFTTTAPKAAPPKPFAADVAIGAGKTAASFVEGSDVLGTMNRLEKGDTADLNVNKIPNLIDAANPLKKMNELAGKDTNWTGRDTTVKPSENPDWSGTSPAQRQQMEQPSNYAQQVGSTAAIVAANAAPFIKGGIPAIKGAAGAVMDTAGAVRDAMPHPIDKLRGTADTKIRQSYGTDIKQLLSSSGGIARKTAELSQKGIDLQKILSDEDVFKGLKVNNKRVEPNDAIDTIDNRIETLYNMKHKKILPVLDRYFKIDLGALQKGAKDFIEGNPGTVKDKDGILSNMKAQLAAYEAKFTREDPTREAGQFKPSEIDQIRADARSSGRDAKQNMKGDSEYAAIETAARDAVFNLTENLPVEGAENFVHLNDYMRQMISTSDFLNKHIRGASLENPRSRGMVMRFLGTMAGSTNGPLGILVGHGIGGLISDILSNTQLGSSFKMSLLRDLADGNPEILKQVDALSKELDAMQPKMLPPGSGKTTLPSSKMEWYAGPSKGNVSTNIEDAKYGPGDTMSNMEKEIMAALEGDLKDALENPSEYEHYTPDNELPVIDFGAGKRPESDLPTIR